MTWDGSDTAANVKFYRNTSLISHDIEINGVSLIAGSVPLQIGSSATNGSLDDVRIYNRVLSATEVQQLYNMGR